MKVFRMENESGNGPYAAEWDFARPVDLDDMVSHHNRSRPKAHQDGIKFGTAMWDVHTRFGMESLDRLRWWFSGYLDLLQSHGFNVITCEVPEGHYRVGTSGQVAFDHQAAIYREKQE